ncbi:MAG: amidase family protein [Syntrophales bacterium]
MKKKRLVLLALLMAFCFASSAWSAATPGQSNKIFEASIKDLSTAMKEKKVTSVQLVDYYLKRIAVYDPLVNSIITINPKARKEAAALDKERAAGKIRGPLHGIPIILKDNFDTKDMPTTSGSLALANLRPPKDAFTVAQLRKAGAVIIAKANQTEFARHGMGGGSMVGQTINPYDLTRTPGGSSSGTGASITSNFAVAGTGSDTVNSIRSPASANSLVGLRPTIGLVSRTGISPCAMTQDVGGPLTKTVTDAAIMLGAMAGYDPADPAMVAIKDKPIQDYTKALNKDGLKGKRIGLHMVNFGNDPDVLAVMNKAVADIKALGATVIEINESNLSSAKLIKENDVQLYESKPNMNDYFAMQGAGSPVKNLTEYLATGKLDPTIVKGLKEADAQVDPLNDPEYKARLARNEETKTLALKVMQDNKLDAFMYPLQSVLVVPIGDPRGQAGRNGIVASVMGWPAITLPGGFSAPSPTAHQGVPIGVEFMGKPYSEGLLLEIGFAYEQATKLRKPPAGLPNLDFSSVKK